MNEPEMHFEVPTKEELDALADEILRLHAESCKGHEECVHYHQKCAIQYALVQVPLFCHVMEDILEHPTSSDAVKVLVAYIQGFTVGEMFARKRAEQKQLEALGKLRNNHGRSLALTEKMSSPSANLPDRMSLC